MSTVAVFTGFEFGTNGGIRTGTPAWRIFSAATGAVGTDIRILGGPNRRGSYGLRISGSNANLAWTTDAFGTGKTAVVFAGWWRVSTDPGGEKEAFVIDLAGAGVDFASIDYEPADDRLRIFGPAGTFADSTIPIYVNDWHWVEFRYDCSTGTHTFDWRIDGITQPGVSGAQAADTIAGLAFGDETSGATGTFDYDDLIVSVTAADYPLGLVKTVLLKVDPAGTFTVSGSDTNFQTFAGTTPTMSAWDATVARDAMGETLPPVFAAATRSGWAQITNAASDYVEMPMQTYTVAGGETLIGARLVAPMWAFDINPHTWSFHSWNGTTDTTLTALGDTQADQSTTAPAWVAAMLTLADVDTQTELDALAIRGGYVTDANPDVGPHAVYVELAILIPDSFAATSRPGAITGTTSVPAPTVATGNATVGAAVITATTTIPVGSTAAGQNPTWTTVLAQYATWQAVLDANVSWEELLGGIFPDRIAATVTMPAVTVTAATRALPAAIPAATTVPAPVVHTGSLTAPATVAATTAVPTVAVTSGAFPAAAVITAVTTVPAVQASGAATATPAAIAATVTLPAVSVTAVTRALPAAVTATTAIPAVTVTTGQAASPAAVTATTTVPAGVVHAGSSAAPATIGAVVTVGASIVPALPPTITTTVTMPGPAVAVGVRLTPAHIAAVTAVPAVGVVAATATFPDPVVATVTMGSVTVDATVNLHPAAIAATTTVPAAGVSTGTLTVFTGFEYGTNSGINTGTSAWRLFSLATGPVGTDIRVLGGGPNRRGSYGLRISGINSNLRWTTDALGTGRTAVVSACWWKASTLPATAKEAFFVDTAATVGAVAVAYDPVAERLTVTGPGGTASSTFPVINDWYWVEFRFDCSSGIHTFDWRINGITQPSLSGSAAASTIAAVCYGDRASGVSGTYDYDDICVSTTAGDYPLGLIKTVLLKVDPAGTVTLSGTAANFQTFAGATPTLSAWDPTVARDALVEVPPVFSSALRSGWVQVTAAAGDYVEMPMETYTAGVGETLRAARLVAPMWAADINPHTFAFRSWNGTAETVLTPLIDTNADASTSAPAWVCAMLAPGDISIAAFGAFEVTTLAIRGGYVTDATPDVGPHAVYVELALGIPAAFDIRARPPVVSASSSLPAPASVSGSAHATPAAVTAAAALPAAAVATGQVATPATVTATTSMPAAAGSTVTTAAPAVITTIVAVPSVTVLATSETHPATIPVAATLPAVAVTAVTRVSPAAVATTITVPAVTVTAVTTAFPAAISAATATPAVTVATGEKALPATIPIPAALPAPVVHTGQVAAPPAIAGSTALPAPTVATGLGVSPGAIAATVAIPAVVVVAAAAALPAAILATTTLPGPAVSVGQMATPATVAATVLVHAVTVTTTSAAVAAVAAVPVAAALPAPAVSASSSTTAAPVTGSTSMPGPVASGAAAAAPIVLTVTTTFPTAVGSGAAHAHPAVMTLTTALPAPVATTGAGSAPPVVTAVTAMPASVVSTGSRPQPPTIGVATLVGVPTTSGSSEASAGPLYATVTVPDPEVLAVTYTTPATVATTLMMPAVVVSSTATATAVTVAAAVAVLDPVVVANADANATPAVITTTITMPAPDVSATVTVFGRMSGTVTPTNRLSGTATRA